MATTTLSTTMLPEPPPLNLGSPRVRAAMRVLGVAPRDLEKKELVAFDGNEARFDMFDRKRRNLVTQVAHMAERGPEASRLLATDTNSNAAFMEEVLRKEEASLNKLQDHCKKDVQKIVIQELAAKLHMHHNQKRQEESDERMQKLRAEQRAQMKLAQKEALKKSERANEVRQKAAKTVEQKGEEITDKMHKANEKAATKLTEVKQAHEEAKMRSQDKRAQLAERQDMREMDLQQQRERQYSDMLASHQDKLSRIASSLAERQQKADLISEKQQKSMQRVHEKQEQRKAEIEERYAEIVERHANHEERRKDLSVQRNKETKVRNSKAKTAHENRWERIQNELDTNVNTSRRLEQMKSEPILRRSCQLDVDAYTQHRLNHTDVVAANRERINRAQHHAVEQQLGKLSAMRARAQGIQDARDQADQRRMEMIRRVAIEKNHLSDQVDKLRDAGPGRMLRLLTDLQPDPDAASKINSYLEELGLSTMGGEKTEDAEKN